MLIFSLGLVRSCRSSWKQVLPTQESELPTLLPRREMDSKALALKKAPQSVSHAAGK